MDVFGLKKMKIFEFDEFAMPHYEKEMNWEKDDFLYTN